MHFFPYKKDSSIAR